MKTRKCCFKLFKKPPKTFEVSTQVEEDPLMEDIRKQRQTIDGLNLKLKIYMRDVDNMNKSISAISKEKIELRKRISGLEPLNDEIIVLREQIKSNLVTLTERKKVFVIQYNKIDHS